MKNSKARAAVVGLGGHGFRHLKAYGKLGDVEIAAVCDVRTDQVAKACAEYPGAKGYTDWKELLAGVQPDILSVVTNGPSHAGITVAAARAGVRRIFCEKPMATSVEDGLEMIAVCAEHGTRLAVSHGRRWTRNYRALRDSIAGGLIGKLSHIWFTCGGGLFAGNGSHAMDLMRMLSGSEPLSVVGYLDQTGTPNPRGRNFSDPGAMSIYFFANGMRGVIDMFEDLGVPPRFEIVGSMGRILIDEMTGRWEVLARGREDRMQPLGHYWLPLDCHEFKSDELEMIDMLFNGLNELLNETNISCTGQDGLASLEMVIGAHVSARNGSVPIQLPLANCHHQLNIPFT